MLFLFFYFFPFCLFPSFLSRNCPSWTLHPNLLPAMTLVLSLYLSTYPSLPSQFFNITLFFSYAVALACIFLF
ncbi:hypothetical protein F5X96DRAFT_613137 [Biscogniauxia mediterranea]|nr:hypothetical protein F5X96DRAFT_613137 [Biscogniauxia mediterranea]